MAPTSFVRASVNGIVFLINSLNGRVYTYNLDNPTYIGNLERIPGEDLNTSEGTLSGANLVLRQDWKTVMETV